MSLQIWLPLTKNAINKGCHPSNVTVSNATYNDNGKLGGCYSFNNSAYLMGTQSIITNNTNEWSFACWMKLNATTTGQTLFSCRTSAAGTGITVFYYGSQWIIDDGTRWQFTPTNTIVTNKWYHVCVVRKKGVGKYLYINGVLDKSTTTTGAPTIVNTTNYAIGVCHNSATTVSGNPLNGYLNDVRFYDHALSPLEVSELAKGLVVHYKLDTPSSISNLVRNVSYSVYNNYASAGFTASLVNTGRTYNSCKIYRLTYTPGSDTTKLNNVKSSLTNHGIYGFSRTFLANTKYCFWILCKPISHPDTIVGGTASNISGWTEIPMKKYDDNWFIVGQCRKGNVTSDKRDSIFTSFKTPSAEAGVPIIIDFCCPHLLEGYDEILPEYDYIGTDPGITDGSGYNNHGTETGDITISTSTPRYSYSTKFVSGSHIHTTLVTSGFANSYTFSWWGKYSNYSGHMMWGFSNGNRLNLYMSSGNFYWNTGDGSNNPFNVSASTYGDNQWHHFAVTGDGTTTKLYIDGEFKGNAKTYKGITGTTIYMNGWDSGTGYNFNGQLSDFRLYATVLTDSDILTLYHTGARVADNGAMTGYEMKEG